MTSQCHVVEFIQNLLKLSCEWEVELWKNGIFSRSKNVLIQKKLSLCHNVNFDVTIMTSLRHVFGSTFGWFYEEIISRKSHQRNFLYLLPFKSYKQNNKSWVIFYPH